jgi:hypothetical protein
MKKSKISKSEKAALIPVRGLTVNVRGLVLVYKKANETMVKMRLPKTEDHIPLIKITSTTQMGGNITSKKTLFSIPIGGSIEISHTGAIAAADPVLDGVLKMNEFHPNARFKPAAQLNAVSGFVSITNAAFTANMNDKANFERWKVNDLLHGKPRGKREFAEDKPNILSSIMGIVSFDPSQSMSTNIQISGIAQAPIITLGYTNTTHIIEISNLCEAAILPSCETKSDFLEYYSMLNPGSIGNNENDFILSDTKGSRAPCNVTYFENGFDPE